jgi:phosphoglucomutase
MGMNAMDKQVGQQVAIGGKSYKIIDYRDNLGILDIISFATDLSVLFARPSGTGDNVRIYIFGEKVSGKKELEEVAEYLSKL